MVAVSDCVAFLFTMWKVWCSRNALTFDGECVNDLAIALLSQHVCIENFLAYGVEVRQQMLPRIVSWNKPPEGTIYLNVDGSALSSPGRAKFGGLARVYMSNFIFGFYGPIMLCM